MLVANARVSGQLSGAGLTPSVTLRASERRAVPRCPAGACGPGRRPALVPCIIVHADLISPPPGPHFQSAGAGAVAAIRAAEAPPEDLVYFCPYVPRETALPAAFFPRLMSAETTSPPDLRLAPSACCHPSLGCVMTLIGSLSTKRSNKCARHEKVSRAPSRQTSSHQTWSHQTSSRQTWSHQT